MQNKFKKIIGMTLIEMLVSMTILVVAIAGFTLLFSRSWQMNKYTIELGQSSLAVSQGMNTMVSYIRKVRQGDDGSYPIISAANNELILFSDYDKDGTTEKLHFYLQDGQIKMGVTHPTGGIPKTYPSGDQQTVILASRIVNDGNTPIFYYYNKDYPGDSEHNPVSTPADVSSVRLIKIYLQINIDPNRAPDNVETQSFVELRNLNDYDRIK